MQDGMGLGIMGEACTLWEGLCFLGRAWCITRRALCIMEEAWCMLVVYA